MYMLHLKKKYGIYHPKIINCISGSKRRLTASPISRSLHAAAYYVLTFFRNDVAVFLRDLQGDAERAKRGPTERVSTGNNKRRTDGRALIV